MTRLSVSRRALNLVRVKKYIHLDHVLSSKRIILKSYRIRIPRNLGIDIGLSTHICRWRRLCQTAFSSGVGALNTITRLLGRLWGLQPPLLLTSTWPFSEFPAGLMAICNRNSVGLFRTVKQASAILDNRRGSSVTNKTRSRETRANTSKSVRSRAHEGCSRARPSTFASAPPNSLKTLYIICYINIILYIQLLI